MKLLHLSDLHLGKRVNEVSMLDEQDYILRQILELADTERPDALVIAGDVYDKSFPSGEAVTLFDDFLVRLAKRRVPVLLISGNHDSPERLAFGSRLLDASGIHISPVYSGSVSPVTLQDAYGPVHFWLLPFLKPAHVKRFFPDEVIEGYTDAIRAAIAHMDVDFSGRNVLITHQFVTGASTCESEELSVGGTDNVDASVFDGFDYVALGHRQRAFLDAQAGILAGSLQAGTPCPVCGSPEHPHPAVLSAHAPTEDQVKQAKAAYDAAQSAAIAASEDAAAQKAKAEEKEYALHKTLEALLADTAIEQAETAAQTQLQSTEAQIDELNAQLMAIAQHILRRAELDRQIPKTEDALHTAETAWNEADKQLGVLQSKRTALKEQLDKLGQSLTYRDKASAGQEIAALQKRSDTLEQALADEVQMSTGIHLDTLFVDEGFGSLDSEALSKAYQTLAGLTDGNRLVGIISHVSELKERIDRQIVVAKGPDGSSRAELVV